MASKAKTKQTDDAPLIDLNEASIKKMIAKAKRKGYVTYDELNEALPSDQMSADQIEDIQTAISDMGVQIVESAEEAEDDDGPEEIAPTGSESQGAEAKQNVPEKKKSVAGEGRTDDPVRM